MENNLEEIRREIDGVDARMAALFEQRMGLVRRVTEYKKAHGLGISDPSREEALVRRNAEMPCFIHFAVHSAPPFQHSTHIQSPYNT